jgi:hypothetical protein
MLDDVRESIRFFDLSQEKGVIHWFPSRPIGLDSSKFKYMFTSLLVLWVKTRGGDRNRDYCLRSLFSLQHCCRLKEKGKNRNHTAQCVTRLLSTTSSLDFFFGFVMFMKALLWSAILCWNRGEVPTMKKSSLVFAINFFYVRYDSRCHKNARTYLFIPCTPLLKKKASEPWLSKTNQD